jgi:2Fe-2S ferredoxin
MVEITFDKGGVRHKVEAREGDSVMRAATENGVPGILGDCGGNLACATCHVYLPDAWSACAGEISEMERELLDCALDVRPNSRLSCQIVVTPDLNGIVIGLPEKQV